MTQLQRKNRPPRAALRRRAPSRSASVITGGVSRIRPGQAAELRGPISSRFAPLSVTEPATRTLLRLELGAELAEQRAELLKWMFLF